MSKNNNEKLKTPEEGVAKYAADNFIISASLHEEDGVDEITKAVQENILAKQLLLLQQNIQDEVENGELDQLFELVELDFNNPRNYLQNTGVLAQLERLMQRDSFRKEMHKIEHEGYSFVHQKFKSSFQDFEWVGSGVEGVRSREIVNEDGEFVCSLSEKTINSNMQVRSSDGSLQTIKQYREVDFPLELESKNGPMHASMAAMDLDGYNISEEDAVYFTAHYNSEGRLTEISSPASLRFNGKDDNAIGYIEVNGGIYTLPITQGRYRAMLKEVEKNKDIAMGQEQGADRGKETLAEEKNLEERAPEVKDIEPESKTLSIQDVSQDISDALKQEPVIAQKNELTGQGGDVKSIEIKDLAAKMRQTRLEKNNIAAEPPEQTKIITLPEAVKLAREMQDSRRKRGNEAAEPELDPLESSEHKIEKVEPIQIEEQPVVKQKKSKNLRGLIEASEQVANAMSDLSEMISPESLAKYEEIEKKPDKLKSEVKETRGKGAATEKKIYGKHTKRYLEESRGESMSRDKR